MKLLIVDDSSFARRKLKQALLLAKPNLEIVEACDGEDALQKIVAEIPDYCITDLVMPKMDGVSFLNEVKTRGLVVKVVVASADIQEQRRKECAELGAAGFFEKPLTAAKITGLLAALES